MMDGVVKALKDIPNTDELYEVTGSADIVMIVSASDMDEFRDILVNQIMKVKGVKSTVSSVVLHDYKIKR